MRLRNLASLAVLLACAGSPAPAQPLTEITPDSADDWEIVNEHGKVEVEWSVAAGMAGGPDRVWRFRADCPYQEHANYVTLRLRFEDFGIPPQPREAIEFVQWEWHIDNRTDADKVSLRLYSEGSGITLGNSPSLFDGNDYAFRIRPTYHELHTTLTEALEYHWTRGSRPDSVGPFLGLDLTLHMPYRQTVDLGVFRFGRAREEPPPQSPREERRRLVPGRYVPADLDGDGVTELLAPWREGPKILRYTEGEFRFVEEAGALSREAPLYLALPVDLDRDGDLDVIGLEPSTIEISVFRNRDGRFTAEGFYLPLPEPDAVPMAMTAADDDGDGRLDLFVAYHLQTSPDVPRIFRLPGRVGGFASPLPVAEAVPPRFRGAYWIATADLDRDGHVDLVSGAPGIGIHGFPGDGAGNYGAPVEMLSLRRGGFHRGIDLVDVNGDGLVDLLYGQKNTSGDKDRDGCNHLVLNLGEFRFRDVTRDVGICGEILTEATLPTETDGVAGLEWLVQEHDGFHLWKLAPLAGGTADSPATLAPPDILLPDVAAKPGRLVTVQDLNRDGRADLVHGNQDEVFVYHSLLPGLVAPGVRTVTAGGVGPGRVAAGGILSGEGWATPLVVNTLGSTLPRLVAATETVRWAPGNRISPADDPGSISNLTGFTDLRTDLRHRPGKLLDRFGKGGMALGLGILTALAVLGALAARRYRRLLRREESRAWRDLLRTVEVTRHSGWRTSVGNLQRRLRMQADAAELREALPRAKIRALRQCTHSANRLAVEGHQMAERSLATLDGLHESGPPALEALEAACRDLLLAMDLIAGSLQEHFSSDPRRAFHAALGELDHRRTGTTRVVWADPSEQDRALAERFPMHEDDLFPCIQELMRNALKKKPAPSRIIVRVFAEGPRDAVFSVIDDGGPLERERERRDRSGEGRGIRDLARILDPYGGTVTLADAADGSGVEARITVKLADA